MPTLSVPIPSAFPNIEPDPDSPQINSESFDAFSVYKNQFVNADIGFKVAIASQRIGNIWTSRNVDQ